jgi:hypothetical protein
MDPGQLLQGRTRETAIRRDELGRWFNDGVSLAHGNLIRSFDRWIERAEDGRYCLKNDANWAYFTLEGPPFFVRSAGLDGDGGVRLRLSNDREEVLVPATLRQSRDGALYCDVMDGTMAARFDAGAVHQLESAVFEDESGVYLELAGRRYRPPVVDDPLSAP